MAQPDSEPEAQPQEPQPARRRLISSAEGRILIAGVVLALLYLGGIAAIWLWRPELGRNLLTMTGSHIFGGRAAGMSAGYAHELDPWLVTVANMIIETFLVLVFYPLFVFSYHKLFVIKSLQETMERTRRTAHALRPTAIKLGVPGLLLFVWFPFWMTGPLVGSIIGFLIGLRPVVTLAVVLGGTYLAILCWSMLLRRLHEHLVLYGPYVPFAFVALILLFAIAIHIRYAFARESRHNDADSPE